MLEYMDDVLGRLFEYLDGSAFKQDTYVMVMSDNGSEMFLGELPKSKVSNPPAAAAEPCMVPCRLSPDTHLLTCGCTMVTQRVAYAAAIASACAAALNLLMTGESSCTLIAALSAWSSTHSLRSPTPNVSACHACMPAAAVWLRPQRMPSRMQGYKRDVEEGGVRNYLTISGPGVQAGVIDSTLTDITDILPTIAALAGISENALPHKPWDGISLQNLVLAGDEAPSSGRRGTSKATQQQLERFVFSMGPMCWDANSVPKLAGDRR